MPRTSPGSPAATSVGLFNFPRISVLANKQPNQGLGSGQLLRAKAKQRLANRRQHKSAIIAPADIEERAFLVEQALALLPECFQRARTARDAYDLCDVNVSMSPQRVDQRGSHAFVVQVL
jgi:hypothetical protein